MTETIRYLKTTGIAAVKQWHNIYPAKVIGVTGLNVTLRVPQVLGNAESNLAVPALPVSSAPDVGTTVYVMFAGGDVNHPVYFYNAL